MSIDEGRLARREILAKALRVGVTAALVAAVVVTGFFGTGLRAFADDTGLKAGAIGGPTGFPNAQLHQYTANDAAGAGHSGAQGLESGWKSAGPDRDDDASGSSGSLGKPFPGGAKAVKDVFKEETGIEIVPVGVVETEQMTKLIQDYQTGARSYDVYSFWSSDLADVAASGALYQLDDFVAEVQARLDGSEHRVRGRGHHPHRDLQAEWAHLQLSPRRGLPDLGLPQGSLRGSQGEGGFQGQVRVGPPVARNVETARPDLRVLNRPDQDLLGCTDLRNQYWGFTNWYMRYMLLRQPEPVFLR